MNRENAEEISFAPSATDLPSIPMPDHPSGIEPLYELNPDAQKGLYSRKNGAIAKYGSGLIHRTLQWFIDLRVMRIPSVTLKGIGVLLSECVSAKGEEPVNPSLVALEGQVTRLQTLDKKEVGLLADARSIFARREAILRRLIRQSHIEPDEYLRRIEVARAMGGPEILLGDIRIAGTDDVDFTSAYLRAAAALDHLSGVLEAMKHFPLAMPIAGEDFDPTSGFGPRLDPFTGKIAFHPGLDFGGAPGTPVFATASGRVAFAGNDGSYGDMVEIDHGWGFHTRYAHLSAIVVRPNAFVSKGSLIGRVGSTGRSTGPHLHYEVWYDNVVRDPASFIVAGRPLVETGTTRNGVE